jgi:hypothetical protein
MPIKLNETACHAGTYQITVEGKIEASWSDWLSGAQFFAQKDFAGNSLTTLQICLDDQAALRGLLNRLWDLNLCVLSVRRIDLAGQTQRNKEKKG